ncbi:GTPase HflX, partial [Escherichia coli]|nr:GTPase HflX [Escherichia coli]
FRENIQAVHEVLEEIDAHEVPTLVVMNKIDNLDSQKPRIERDEEGVPRAVWVSAMDGLGIDVLFEALTERLASQMVEHQLR